MTYDLGATGAKPNWEVLLSVSKWATGMFYWRSSLKAGNLTPPHVMSVADGRHRTGDRNHTNLPRCIWGIHIREQSQVCHVSISGHRLTLHPSITSIHMMFVFFATSTGVAGSKVKVEWVGWAGAFVVGGAWWRKALVPLGVAEAEGGTCSWTDLGLWGNSTEYNSCTWG